MNNRRLLRFVPKGQRHLRKTGASPPSKELIMAELTLRPDSAVPEIKPRKKATSSASRVLRYVLTRIATLFVTVIVGVYLTILIANMGGYVDNIQRAQIREEVQQQFLNNP